MSKQLESLLGAVAKANEAKEAAEAKLAVALEDVADGTVLNIGSLAHEVYINAKGEKRLKCLVSKRVKAALEGKPVPPIVRRPKKDAAEAAQ